MFNRIEKWSRWDRLRRWGASPLVRSSVLFAAAGYFLLWNDRLQIYLTIKFDAAAHYSLWRIWMLYYGGVALAIATGLYSYLCPPAIKEHSNAFELAANESQYLATMGLGRRYLDDVIKLEASCSELERKLFPSDRPKEQFIDQIRGTTKEPQGLAALIVYAWRLHNIRYPIQRPIILVIYWIGFALVGFPAVVTFAQITKAAFRALL